MNRLSKSQRRPASIPSVGTRVLGMDEFQISLVAGGFALGGSLLGTYLTRTNEHKQWLRNEKLKAYNDYLAVFGGGHIGGYFEIIEASGGSSAKTGLERIEELHALCVRVMVLAPSEIGDEVQKTIHEMLKLKTWMNDLQTRLKEKHHQPVMSGHAMREAEESMATETTELLMEKLSEYASDSIKRLGAIANLIREDLRVSDQVSGRRWSRLVTIRKRIAAKKARA